jgi:hypothetical protein
LKERAKELQGKVARYAMLPAEERGARREVDKLKRDLEYLRRERDQLWEKATKG